MALDEDLHAWLRIEWSSTFDPGQSWCFQSPIELLQQRRIARRMLVASWCRSFAKSYELKSHVARARKLIIPKSPDREPVTLRDQRLCDPTTPKSNAWSSTQVPGQSHSSGTLAQETQQPGRRRQSDALGVCRRGQQRDGQQRQTWSAAVVAYSIAQDRSRNGFESSNGHLLLSVVE